MTVCPFCTLPPERIILENDLALAIRDAFPVSQGHTLIIPRRHIASITEATEAEFAAIWALAAEARRRLDAEKSPDGYNIGINDGEAAGQTVMHLHVHLIPRYKGDSRDPRGGVRWMFPEKAKYWDRSPAK